MSDTFVVGATTITFVATLLDGRSRKSDSETSERHIPAGDTNYVDLGGKKAKRLNLSLELASGSDLLALEALVGQQGTLTQSVEGTLTCVLESLDASDWWPGGHQVAKAVFLVVSAAAAADTAPVAGFVVGISGLDVTIDANQGSSTVDSLVDQVNVEWGDTNTSIQNAGAPYDLTAYEIPLISHTYGAAGAYQINVSIERSSVTSGDNSQIVTVGAV